MTTNNNNNDGAEFLGAIDPDDDDAFKRATLAVKISRANGGTPTEADVQRIAAKRGVRFSADQVRRILS